MFAIETQGLTKRYGKQRGIESVSLQVPEGSIFGFIGPNGAGKSTTIRTLLGLLQADGGSASLLGRDVLKQGAAARRDVGYVPSEGSFYDDLTVRETIDWLGRFHPGDHTARRDELVSMLELDVTRRAIDLSQGNRRKTSLVAALQHRPRLIILDEPTNGLDPVMQARLFDLLQAEAQRGATVFFSSHVLSEVERVCSTVAVVSEGRVVAVEEVAKLRHRQRRRISLTFANPLAEGASGLPAPLVSLAGVEQLARPAPTRVEFLFGGDMPSLLRALADAAPADVRIEEPSLEEIFLSHYTKH